jgi:two-component system chemotaxis sensor kinase CheA
MGDTDDLVKEFLVESCENLDRLDQDFVALEKDSTAKDRLASIFRTIHTIKGTCGFLGFSKLESVTHVGESLLSRLRDGELKVNSEIISALLKLVDSVREILASIESASSEGNGDYTALIKDLNRLKDGGGGNAQAPAVAAASNAAPAPAPVAAPSAPVAQPKPEPVPAPEEHAATSPAATAERETGDKSADKSGEHASPNAANSGIRVDVGLLDKLMNLVGELVLARNQILQFSATTENATLAGSTQRLNLITTELQEGVMKTRMQPIGNVWSKFPRVVRDVSQMCGKKVRVEMEGKETELDKTIIEAIKDPLTHIIRNSVDHGIETPEKRRAAGKSEEGRLFLRAFHEGGQVNIEIVDDGAGVNISRVKQKAVERGLISADHAARMSDREATNLIFLPGFSTAEKVTNVSGRGVGMDVVKTNIERIGGTVDVQSKVGEGTTLRIKIPLTLAIIPALVITSNGDRFAIPQVSLLELVKLDAAKTSVERIHGAPVFRLRGNLLPLVYLDEELKLQSANAKPGEQASSNIVVLRAGERQFGLVVDHINDTEEIVVKPLGKQLKGINVFAGATIMGDGKVALILDVVALAQKANVIGQHGTQEVQAAKAANAADAEKQTLLLFTLRNEQRMAIPLSLVARLEEFQANTIEDAGGQSVVQYRNEIMPLISLDDVLTERRKRPRTRRPTEETAKPGKAQVVVYSHGGRNVGLRVERIVDVVEEHVRLQASGARPGVQGTAVIKEKVTEVLDVKAVIEASLGQTTSAAA